MLKVNTHGIIELFQYPNKYPCHRDVQDVEIVWDPSGEFARTNKGYVGPSAKSLYRTAKKTITNRISTVIQETARKHTFIGNYTGAKILSLSLIHI